MSTLTAKYIGGPLDGQVRKMTSDGPVPAEPPSELIGYSSFGGELQANRYVLRGASQGSSSVFDYTYSPSAD